MLICLQTVCDCNGKGENLQQRLRGWQRQKYLVPGPLQKKSADPWSMRLEACPEVTCDKPKVFTHATRCSEKMYGRNQGITVYVEVLHIYSKGTGFNGRTQCVFTHVSPVQPPPRSR